MRTFVKLKPVRLFCACYGLSLSGMALSADGDAAEPDAASARPLIAAIPKPKTTRYNLGLLQGGGKTLDVQSLLGDNSAMPGSYRSDIYVNQHLAGRHDVELVINPSGDVEPCLPLDLLELAGVDMAKIKPGENLHGPPHVYPNMHPAAQPCYSLPALIDQATANYDPQRLRLDLSVPHASMSRGQRGYVDPSAWDAGIPVGFVNYSFNTRYDRGASLNTRYSNLGLRNGVNIGGWRLRNESNLNNGSRYATSFTSNNTYAQHDITALKSQFWAGDTYTLSPIHDSVRFRGIQLVSDEGMRPDSERGYAPVVRGIAETNATVEIRQNNFLIYTANVAPGPFEISDLSPSGSNSDLDITIIEADGRRRVSRQAFSSPPLMVREGRLLHSLAMGQFRSGYAGLRTPAFASGSLLYGLTNNLTVVGGFESARGYSALTVGAGINSSMGALSADLTHASSRVNGANSSGKVVRLRYGKFLEGSATNVSISATRALQPAYRSLTDHVQELSGMPPYSQPRSRVDLSLSQQLGANARYGNLFLTGSDQRYWNGSNSQSVTAGYSGYIGKVSYSLGVSHARNLDTGTWFGNSNIRQNSTLVSFNMSFPLGTTPTAPRAMVSATHQGNGRYTAQTGLYGNIGDDRDLAYSLQAGRDNTGRNFGSAALNANTSVANVGGGLSFSPGYQSANFSAYGSLVAHAGGVNVGQPLGETFALIQIDPPVPGIKLDNYAGASTGYNGYAVMPYATPYKTNWIGLDTRERGSEIELENGMQQVVPRRGAVPLVVFRGVTGRRVQFQLATDTGAPLPFGTVLENESGDRLGISDPTGRALVLLDKDSGNLTMRWDERQCSAAYLLPPKQENENYLRLGLQCGMESEK